MSGVCPDDATLRGLLDGSLHDDATFRIVTHLDSCENCRRRLEKASRWDEVSEELKGLRDQALTSPRLDRFMVSATQLRNERASSVNAALKLLSPSDEEGVLGEFREYKILDIAGQGGMGIVLKAWDPRLDRVVAVKQMTIPDSHDLKSRFSREAKAVAAVAHENVVAIHAADEHNGKPFLVMQFVEGMSLAELIDQQGPLTPKRFVRLATQITAGLRAVHNEGLVHRDLKPSNVLIDETDKALLTDFGLAKVVRDNSLTVAGTLLGTPAYMSPEQARATDVDRRSDLFSLGATYYSMCTGVAPFQGNSTREILEAVCSGTPTAIRDINPDIPPWIETLVVQLMEKNPDKRISTDEVIRQLNSRTHNFSLSLRRRQVLIIFGTIAILVITLLFAFWPRGREFYVVSGGTSFGKLQQAIDAAIDGDVVEIRSNGPFSIDPIDLGDRSLTIQAAHGYTPVLQATSPTNAILITNSRLKISGIELSNEHPTAELADDWSNAGDSLILIEPAGQLEAAYCRFRMGANRPGVSHRGVACDVRHCHILGDDTVCVLWQSAPGATLSLVNNHCHTKVGVAVRSATEFDDRNADDGDDCELSVIGNSMRFGHSFLWMTDSGRRSHRMNVKFDHNAILTKYLVMLRPATTSGEARLDSQPDASRWFNRSVVWRGQQNAYGNIDAFLQFRKQTPLAKTLDRWLALTDPTASRIPGDRSELFPVADLTVLREKGRLQGLDTGVDPSKVGPGVPYEDWQNTAVD